MGEDRGRGRDRIRGPRRAPARAGRTREPRLTRTRSRAGDVVRRTTGALGLSSTRRAAVLALVVCALALTVSVPLRNYVAQRQELAAVTAQQEVLAAEVERLTRERERLTDPTEVAAEARARLGLVEPGEVPYVVQFPAQAEQPAPDPDAGRPWFDRLWSELADGPAEPAPVGREAGSQ